MAWELASHRHMAYRPHKLRQWPQRRHQVSRRRHREHCMISLTRPQVKCRPCLPRWACLKRTRWASRDA
jgi:hypothetical protein